MPAFNLPVSIFKEGKAYIAFSPVLDISTSGATPAVARRRFDEAARLFFEEVIEKNTLNEVLANLGWSKMKKNWQPPKLIRHESERMVIPAFA